MKYLLISVCELEIETEEFDDYNNCRDTMMHEFSKAYGDEVSIDDMDTFDDDDAGFDEWSAYVCDGANHDNYSWRIVAID